MVSHDDDSNENVIGVGDGAAGEFEQATASPIVRSAPIRHNIRNPTKSQHAIEAVAATGGQRIIREP